MELREHLKITDKGKAKCFIGMEITQKPGEINLFQPKHIEELLEVQGLSDCNGCKTPMQPNIELEPVENKQTIHEIERY